MTAEWVGIIATLAMSLLAIAIMLILAPADRKSLFAWLLPLSFILKLVLAFALLIALNAGAGDGFAYLDDRVYDIASREISAAWDRGESVDVVGAYGVKNSGYYYFVAGLYWLFGESTVVARIANVLLATLTLPIVYHLGASLYDKGVARRTVLVVAFLPDVAFWSALQFKDTLIGFLLLLSVASLVGLLKSDRTMIWASTFVVTTGALYFLRYELALIVGGVTMVAHGWRAKATLTGPAPRAVFFILGTAVVLAAVVTGALENRASVGGQSLASILSPERLLSDEAFVLPESKGREGLLSVSYIYGTQDLWRLPHAIYLAISAPFPYWPNTSLVSENILAVFSLPWLLLAPAMVFGLVNVVRRQRDVATMSVWFITSAQLLLLAVYLHTFSASRHRLAFVPLLCMFAVAHWRGSRAKMARDLIIGTLVLFALTVVYVGIKGV